MSRSEENLQAAVRTLSAGDGLAPDRGCGSRRREGGCANGGRRSSSILGRPDVLVNSAGAAKRYAPEELSPEAYRQAMDAKYFTYAHAIDAVISGMAERHRGSIVNIIGMGGKAASTLHIAGGSANAALMLTTVGLATAYAPMGVRVNAINPGLTQTSRVEEGLEGRGPRDGTRARPSCSRPRGRAFRSGAWRPPRTSQPSRCSSRPIALPTSPARSCRWTARQRRCSSLRAGRGAQTSSTSWMKRHLSPSARPASSRPTA